MKSSHTNALLGAAFLMATSAIGPGFLTQTTVFTERLGASFGFAILVSVLLDIAAQVNIWRIVGMAEKRAQDIANELAPGLGYILAALIFFGGLAFNIGNLAGAGLGLNVLFGIDVKYGAVFSAVIAILIFVVREAGKVMDRMTRILGLLMIVLTLYVAWKSAPPLGLAIQKSFLPDKIDLNAILTIVGGTVGGYITFAGAHRLMDAGVKGKENIGIINRSAITAISLASLMRILLFLAALGVVYAGAKLGDLNPAASVFRIAAGLTGYRFFGIVLWSAAITSVVGSAYTSVSFVKSLHPLFENYFRQIVILFILFSTIIFTIKGQPIRILLLAGALNGLILPIALTIMLLAAHRGKIMGDYKHPLWMTVIGTLVILTMSYIGLQSMLLNIGKI